MKKLLLILGFLISVKSGNSAKAVFIKFEEDETNNQRNVTVSFRGEMNDFNDRGYQRIDVVDDARSEIEKFIEHLFRNERGASVNVLFEDISTQQHVRDLDNLYIYDFSQIENPKDLSYGPPRFIEISVNFSYTGNEPEDAEALCRLKREFKNSQRERHQLHERRLRDGYY